MKPPAMRSDISPDLWAIETEQPSDVRRQAFRAWIETDLDAYRHPLFGHFGVKPVEGLRVSGAELVVPLRDATGRLANLAYVQEDGRRRYLSDADITGAYFSLGRYDVLAQLEGRSNSIVCCVGFINGVRIHQRSGVPVAISFTRDNLLVIAQLMQARHPSAEVMLLEPDGQHLTRFEAVAAADDHAARAPAPLAALAADLAGDPCDHASLTAAVKNAERLIRWIERKRLTSFNRLAVMQLGPSACRPLERARRALGILMSTGWLQPRGENDYEVTAAARAALKLLDAQPSEIAEPDRLLATSDGAEAASQLESAS